MHARRRVEPNYSTGPVWVDTYGPLVADLNAKIGFPPDPMQEHELDRIFAIQSNGLPAAFSYAVVACRQNIKTALLMMASIGWMFVTREQRVTWTAHEEKTAADAQLGIASLIEDSPLLSKRLPQSRNHGIYDANGQQRIELTDGRRIEFRTRTAKGGRGLAADKVVLDEAFALQASQIGSLLPTMATRPNGQVLYASSAGMLGSDILRDIRDRGRAGTSDRMAYTEWGSERTACADELCLHPKDGSQPGCALDRRDLWLQANPAITTGRISLQTIADFRQELPPAEFMRECLGWWEGSSEDGGSRLIRPGEWQRIQTTTPPPADSTRSFGIAFNAAGTRVSVAGAAKHADGVHLELVDSHTGEISDGLSGLADWLENRRGSTAEIRIAGGSTGRVLYQELRDRKLPERMLHLATTSEYLSSCSMLYNAVRSRQITVPLADEADVLEQSVAVCDQKARAGGWGWQATTPDGDETPLEALGTALMAARTTKRNPARKQVIQ